jgi:hypothetical protein
MPQKSLAFRIFLSALALVVLAQPVMAEVACVIDVSYRWIKEPSTQASGDVVAPEPREVAAAQGSSSSAGSIGSSVSQGPVGVGAGAQPGEQVVRFVSVERRGPNERTVKMALQIEVNRQKARAHERCKRDHESFGDCVSTKMSTKVATLNSLSFSARSRVEEALIEECRLQQGRCIAVDSGDPVCRELASSSEPAAAESSEGGRDAAAKDQAGNGKTAGKEAGKAPETATERAKSIKKKS